VIETPAGQVRTASTRPGVFRSCSHSSPAVGIALVSESVAAIVGSMTRSGNVEPGYRSKHFNRCKIAITLKSLQSARHWVVGRLTETTRMVDVTSPLHSLTHGMGCRGSRKALRKVKLSEEPREALALSAKAPLGGSGQVLLPVITLSFPRKAAACLCKIAHLAVCYFESSRNFFFSSSIQAFI
jgi:hypothetical protein